MNGKRVLYVDNGLSLRKGLGLLPTREDLHYCTATNYLRAKRKIESTVYAALILRDLEIPSPVVSPSNSHYQQKKDDYLVLNGLPIENSLNFLRLAKDAKIPRIAILSNKDSEGIVRIVGEEELAQIINEDVTNPNVASLAIKIYNTLRNIFENLKED
jgi:hypothetical protein